MGEQETVRVTVEEAQRLDQEIARLREDLSRAAVREGELLGHLESALLTSDLTVVKCRCGAWSKQQPDLEHYDDCPLSDPSPLAEAAQEVLEILLAFDAEGLDLTFDSEDQGKILRFRALLEGRGEG